MARNPRWTRDEIILALDLFFKVNPLHTSEKHPNIVALSELLNKFPSNTNKETDERYRNPNGVYMKMCNFLHFDPSYSGVGLKAGSKLDRAIWDEFSVDRTRLERVAAEIRENAKMLIAYSWTLQDENTAIKVLDKSAFLHRGTGIPVEIRSFFVDDVMNPGERRDVALICNGKEYAAHIEIDHQESPRTRLFWNADYVNMLKTTYPIHYQQYLEGKLDGSSGLLMRFERLEHFSKYRIILSGKIAEDALEQDIEADEIEEKGPSKEGAIKEYYGKRYERDPANRMRAIEIHGLSCNVCGFNFEETYGERGKDYIEVHHVKPISSFEGNEQDIDPNIDLITLCSNCHRMVHRKLNNVLSISVIKKIYNKMKNERG